MRIQYNFLYLLIFLIPQNLFAQETSDESALNIIDKYIEAIGGKDNLQDIKTLILKGTGKNGLLEMDLPMNIYIKNPDKTRTEVEIMEQQMVSAFDGDVIWELNPFVGNGKAREVPQRFEALKLKNSVFFILSKYLLNYKEKGFKAKYLGKANFQGKKTHRVQLASEYGLFDYYLDIRTYYLLMAKVNGEKHYFDDYKKVGSITIPHFLKNERTGFQMNIEEVVFNETINDDKFEMPYTQFNPSENILLNKKINDEIFDFSEEDLTGDEIIEKFFESTNYKTYSETKFKSSKIVGSIRMGSIDFPFTMYVKSSKKYRMEINAMGHTGILATNGKRYWEVNPFKKNPKPQLSYSYDGGEVYEDYYGGTNILPYQNDIVFDFADELLIYDDEYTQTEYLGKVDIHGKTSHVVKIIDDGDEETLCFFDVENYYLLMKYYKYSKTQEYYDNYQKVDEFYLPFNIETTNIIGTRNSKVEYQSIAFNEKFSSKLFDFPKE